jgi:hypothetical protein
VPDPNLGDISHTTDRESRAQEFLDRVNEQRKENLAITAATTNVNPDPSAQNTTDELWMKKLGVSNYIAGLWRDEMAKSYNILTLTGIMH